MKNLSELHRSGELIFTAHRGAAFGNAENTIPAFEQAIQSGADLLEFDVRMSRDGVPVILHDSTIDRTSDGRAPVNALTLAELKRYNFSWYSHFERLAEPLYDHNEIPTFEEVLAQFGRRCCMNIQVYADAAGVREICRLYRQYEMTDRGYLTIASDEVAQLVRSYSPDIEICLTPGWNERSKPEMLRKCADFGCRFVQPVASAVSTATFELCDQLGLRANVFFADTASEVERLRRLGASGVMTNKIDTLISEYNKGIK